MSSAGSPAGVLRETEAPLGRVELPGRDAEIEDHCVHRADPLCREDRSEVAKRLPDQTHPRTEPRQPAGCRRQRVVVPIETEQPAARSGPFEDRFGVASPSHRGVDYDGARHQAEEGDRLLQQHGLMRELIGHGIGPVAGACAARKRRNLEPGFGVPRSTTQTGTARPPHELPAHRLKVLRGHPNPSPEEPKPLRSPNG